MRGPCSLTARGCNGSCIRIGVSDRLGRQRTRVRQLGLDALQFRNPFYPVQMSFGPIRLRRTEAPLSSVSVSEYWASYPTPARWLGASDVQSSQRTITRAMVGIAAVSVVTMSGGDYLRVRDPTLESLLARTEQVVSEVCEGGTLCIARSHQTAFLYASVFHPNRHYRTKAIFNESEPGCTLIVDPENTRP